MYAKDISDKVFLYKLCKEPLKLKKMNDPIKE
jgi:hypothetical protein